MEEAVKGRERESNLFAKYTRHYKFKFLDGTHTLRLAIHLKDVGSFCAELDRETNNSSTPFTSAFFYQPSKWLSKCFSKWMKIYGRLASDVFHLKTSQKEKNSKKRSIVWKFNRKIQNITSSLSKLARALFWWWRN